MTPRARAGVVAAALAAALAPVPAAAGGVTFNTTTTSIVEYHWDNEDGIDTNDDYVDIVNKLNLSFKTPVLQTDLRLDTFTLLPVPGKGESFSDVYPKPAPSGKRYRDDYRLERLTGILRPAPGLTLTFGDFYAQFGNGIALALRKVDELGLETVLRGGRIDAGVGLFSMTLLGGVTNVNNIDPQDQYWAEDPLDRLAGARVGVRTPDSRLKLHVHYVFMRPASREISDESTHIAGGTIDAVLVPGKLMMGLEGDFGWFDGEHDETAPEHLDEHTGFAVYVNLRSTLGPVSLLLEGKWYDTFALEGTPRYETDIAGTAYNQPPTAERIDQEVDSSSTVVGGRLKVDWHVVPSLTLFANLGGGDYVSLADVFRSASTARHGGQYLHAYGGLDLRWSMNRSSLVLSGGYRTEREPRDREDLDAGWKEHKYIGHAEAKLNLFLDADWTVHVSLLHEQRMKLGFNDEFEEVRRGYVWGTHILGFSWAGVLDVSGAFEYDTAQARFMDPDFRQDASWYGWGQVKWFIRQGLIWSVFAGTQRGGLKCVGGVCKMVPPFAGVKTELIFRY
jgi:hypothetical protein